MFLDQVRPIKSQNGHNAANEKIIGVQTPEETSKNYPNIGIGTIKLDIDRFFVVFGSFLGRMNSDSYFVCCVVIVVQMRFF